MILNFLKRTTSSGKVLLELDGLRALAIFMVIYFHLWGFLNHHLQDKFENVSNILDSILHNGDNGVPVFFAISAFILGLPFAKFYIFSERRVNLKKYFIRRFTRLQPTYFIVLMVFGLYYTVTSKYDLSTIISSFISGNFYIHNILFKTGNYLNYVSWSLEVEFQFYLVLPLLALVFKLPKPLRRILLLIAIISGSYLQYNYKLLSFISLLNYYHYFLAGLLCVDLYLDEKIQLNINKGIEVIIGVLCLYVIIAVQPHHSIGCYLIPIATSAILTLALKSSCWKSFFSLPLLAMTGTMSYSMYLIHFQIIAIGGLVLLWIFNATNSISLLLLAAIVLVVVIWICSAIVFKFIEKPFMNPTWYKLKK
ncbi:acyltransferase family protein [Carboxylicivirga marina]|uniref:Acyltransferase n=1 Tax=Carboxylicivirga marina TaxID=2800988 RepID=A0ABS1HKI8_9BACT|nr:acyltransferase [Carboxylicivirga marina]MBK3517669.1 acyltransferase [Carboxylicivirga marina]